MGLDNRNGLVPERLPRSYVQHCVFWTAVSLVWPVALADRGTIAPWRMARDGAVVLCRAAKERSRT
jgi:hypothetical protein